MDNRLYSIARIAQPILSNKISMSKLHWDEGCSLALRAEGRVEADYVPGCDGTRSAIRDAIGAGLDGSDDGRRNVNVTFRTGARCPRPARQRVE
jgi:2-polyprenyl-6-methoxyphenol hydroxylase-like FAD-dependent oxidoreductase